MLMHMRKMMIPMTQKDESIDAKDDTIDEKKAKKKKLTTQGPPIIR